MGLSNNDSSLSYIISPLEIVFCIIWFIVTAAVWNYVVEGATAAGKSGGDLIFVVFVFPVVFYLGGVVLFWPITNPNKVKMVKGIYEFLSEIHKK